MSSRKSTEANGHDQNGHASHQNGHSTGNGHLKNGNGHCKTTAVAEDEDGLLLLPPAYPPPPSTFLLDRVALYLISFLAPGQDVYTWGRLQWNYLTFYIAIHLLGLYGIWLFISGSAKWQTMVSAYVEVILGTFGILAGAHRCWAHKSFKARLPFSIFLAIANTLGFMFSIFRWARDHRQHHKYSDTHADPHNASRGFFYSHIGWLLFERHPLYLEKKACIDTADLKADSVVLFQHLWYKPLAALIWAFLPTFIPVVFWSEHWATSFAVCVAFRWVLTCHNIFLINSAAHLWGTQPYSTRMKPCENMFVSYTSLGEGYHNYHHYFPSDYSASELGWNHTFNPSSFLIELAEWLGLAYDLRKPKPEMVKAASKKLGDGTYEEYLKASTHAFGLRQCATACLYFTAPITAGMILRWGVSRLWASLW